MRRLYVKSSFFSLASIITAATGLVALLLLALTAGISPTSAAPLVTIYVDGALGNDGNTCLAPGVSACATIAGGLDKASNNDTIEIAAGTYIEHDILVDKAVTLQGAGAVTTIVDANFAGRVFKVQNDATIADLTIQNGKIVTTSSVVFDQAGAGILNSGQLLLDGVILTNNEAQGSGGAIFSNDELTINDAQIISNTANGNGGGIYQWPLPPNAITVTNSIISGNRAIALQGGGIFSSIDLIVRDSTIANNIAPNSGGGLLVGGQAVLERITVTGNEAQVGAGIFSQAGTADLTNVTVSGNTASNNYGGIYLTGPSVAFTMTNSTIANNDRIGTNGNGFNGLMVGNSASATFINTIFSGNEDNNCVGSSNLISQGYNISSDSSCGLTGTQDLPSTDPVLSSLGDFGGPTHTHALQSGSPAIDSGDNGSCPAVDQRGLARPVDGDNSGVATCDRGAYEVSAQLSIEDLTILEGNSGSSTAQFTVTLSPTTTQVVTVFASTTDGSATAGSDYTAISNQQIVFAPGQSTQFVDVSITGDTDDESDEDFVVNLSQPTGVEIIDGSATGTIIDDDGLPSLTIEDVTLDEGNSGSTAADFVVTLSPAAAGTVTVDYATADGSATAGSDYTAANGQLSFGAGEISKTISVDVLGDVVDEGASETFEVNLSGASGANLGDGNAAGTITDDDTAIIRHEFGPQILEGTGGTTTAYFTATLTTPADYTITVDYEIKEGFGINGAKFGSDITGTVTGTLTFDPGETVQTYPVSIIADLEREDDESFSALLSNANPLIPIQPNSSLGSILNDDQYRLLLPILIR